MPASKQEEKKPEPKIAEMKDNNIKMESTVQKKKGSNTLIWVSAIIVVLAALITWAVLDYERFVEWFDKNNDEVVLESPKETITEDAVLVQDAETGAIVDLTEVFSIPRIRHNRCLKPEILSFKSCFFLKLKKISFEVELIRDRRLFFGIAH